MDKYCPKCGIKNYSDAIFCKNCGARLSGDYLKNSGFTEPEAYEEDYSYDDYHKQKYNNVYPSDNGVYPETHAGSKSKLLIIVAIVLVLILVMGFLFAFFLPFKTDNYYYNFDSEGSGDENVNDEQSSDSNQKDTSETYVKYITTSTVWGDNFNDEVKNPYSWTEIYKNGTWSETNERTEFKLYENSAGGRKEGIQSVSINESLSKTQGLRITWDTYSSLGSTGRVGHIVLEINDGRNWIRAGYNRWKDSLYIKDSDDNATTYLNKNKYDGNWDNEIIIFRDQYYIRIDEDESGWIQDSIFSTDNSFKIKLYINVGGEQNHLYTKSGFDNVKIYRVQKVVINEKI